MEIVNAFIGRQEQPAPEDVAAALGKTAGAWSDFLKWMKDDKGVVNHEWKTYSRTSGWTLRPILKKKIIVHLGPCRGCFRVAFALNDKAIEAARQAKLPTDVARAVGEAVYYPEGWAVRLVVQRESDMAAIRRLVEIKLAN